MISYVDNGNAYEFRGLSTDTKPDDVPNGCIFLEMDTSKVFMFDKSTSTWKEL